MVADEFWFGCLKRCQRENLGANILRGIAGAGVLSGFDLVRNAYIAMRTS